MTNVEILLSFILCVQWITLVTLYNYLGDIKIESKYTNTLLEKINDRLKSK